jgi:hypothetical protein
MEGEKKGKVKKFRELSEEERKKLIEGAKKKYFLIYLGTPTELWSSLSAIQNAKFTKNCPNSDILWPLSTRSKKLITK